MAGAGAVGHASVEGDADQGDIERARSLQEEVRKFRLAVQEYAPIPAQKRLLAISSGDERWANVRPPLTTMPDDTGRELGAALPALRL